ncbi:hypothetical protein Gotur_024410, partial [Gossypium turneri]
MEGEFAGLSLEEEEDEILQIQFDVETNGEVVVLQLVGCFLTASIVHFPAMRNTIANVWHPVKGVQIRDLGEKRYERLSLFCFYCGRLSHSDSFCEARMELGVEAKEMGGLMESRGSREFLDLVLGINLTGREYYTAKGNGNWSGNLENSSMEHDLEDEVI